MAVSDRIGNRAKFLISVIFVLLAVAAVLSRVFDEPTGPWQGMYVGFWRVWILAIVAMILLIFLISMYHISWMVLLVASIVFSNIFIALTLSWGVPFGYLDVWTHFSYIQQHKLRLQNNPYPALHTLVILQSELFDLPIRYTFSRITSVALTNGVLLITIAIRQVLDSKKSQKITVIASIPMVFVGFNVRPFTLAWPFAALLWWLIIGSASEPRRRFLMLVLTFPLLFLHPELIAFGLVFIGWGWALSFSSLDHLRNFEIRAVPSTRLIPFIAIVTLFVLHTFLINNTGIYLSARTFSQIFDVVGPSPPSSGASPPSSGASPASSGASPATGVLKLKEGKQTNLYQLLSHLSEFFRRSTYVIALGMISLLAVYNGFRQRHLSFPPTVSILSSGTVVLMFVVIDVVIKSSGVSALMILWVLPIILLPLVARGLDVWPKWRGVFAALVLIAGLSVAFPSPYSGGVVHSTSNIEIVGYEWVKDNHSDRKVVNTRVSSVTASGIWSRNPWPSAPNDYKYSWLAPENPAFLYIVDGHERAMASREALETDDYSSINQLRRFRITNHMIYQNGVVSIYSA